MTQPFRILDTGLRDARQHVALDQALIALHKAGQSPDTIRFVRFPPTVLLGRHQAVADEVKLAYCRDNGVGLVRRVTGGGAIYLDEGQIGWELLVNRQRFQAMGLGEISRVVCEAVAHGLSRTFGIDARFRARSDIEVDGRKLCGSTVYVDGDTLICHGTLLVDADPAHIYRCLNRPDPSLAATRLTTLKTLASGVAPPLAKIYQAVLLGLIEKLGIEAVPGEMTDTETELARMMLDAEIASDSFVFELDDPRVPGTREAHRATPGGHVSAFLQIAGDGADARIRDARIAGDFFVLPPRFVYDLEKALKDALVSDIGAIAERFASESPPEVATLPLNEFRDVLVAAAMEPTTP